MRRITLASLLLALLAPLGARAEAFMFISGASGVRKITRVEVRAAFFGKLQAWPDGTAVRPFLPTAGSPELRWLAEEVFEIDESLLLSKFRQEMFKGALQEAGTAPGATECIAGAKQNPGAICLVRASQFRGLPPGVHVVPYSRN